MVPLGKSLHRLKLIELIHEWLVGCLRSMLARFGGFHVVRGVVDGSGSKVLGGSGVDNGCLSMTRTVVLGSGRFLRLRFAAFFV